jgi:chromosome segregation ATPase
MQTTGRIIRGWLGKLLPGLLIVALPMVAGGFWLSSHDGSGFTARRREQLQTLGEERARLHAALADIHARMDRISGEITVEHDRSQKADKVISQLKELQSTWDRLVGNREQQQANEEQLARMRKLRADATEHGAALQQELKRSTWERDGLEITRASIDERLSAVEHDGSAAGHYLHLAWSRLEGWIIAGLGLYYLAWAFLRARPGLHSGKD